MMRTHVPAYAAEPLHERYIIWLGVLLAHIAPVLLLAGRVAPDLALQPTQLSVSGRLITAAATPARPAMQPVSRRKTETRASDRSTSAQHSRAMPQHDASKTARTPPGPSATPVHDTAAASTAPHPRAAEDDVVTPPQSDASGLSNPAPAYPAASRRLNEQGRVLLEIYILADGSVGELRIKRSSGSSRLDNAAINAVRRWHYHPARRGNQPIAFWYLQPVDFVLED